MLQDQEQRQSELFWAGFQPKRFGGGVKIIRRLLWPFVRPFFFHILHRIDAMEDMNRAVVIDHVNRIEAQEKISREQEQKINRALKQKTQEMEELVKLHIVLRSDLAALKNRYQALESLDERMIGLEGKFSIAPLKQLVMVNSAHGIFIGKPGEIISDFIIGGGVWDSHVIELASEVAKTRRGMAIDAGAHMGSITIALAKLFDHVASFEPNDFNFKILQANVAINNLKNVQLFNTGLYSHATTLSLGDRRAQETELPLNEHGEFDGNSGKNLGAYFFAEKGSGLFGHAAKTLDSYEFSGIALIKIDVQGADGEVLMGALETIQRCRPVLVFEWEETLSKNFDISLNVVREKLEALNYKIDVLKEHNEKQVDYVARPIGD